MKQAKDGGRWIVRYRFDDGTTETRDALSVAAELYDQQGKYIKLLKIREEEARVARHRGTDTTREKAEGKFKALDEAIQGCLDRRENTRRYSKTWAFEYKFGINAVNRRIRLAKSKHRFFVQG